ncbi:MAG: hypothetical protein AAGD25_06675 [Cyanobacteria bacterium P01_F01_bin.150]
MIKGCEVLEQLSKCNSGDKLTDIHQVFLHFLSGDETWEQKTQLLNGIFFYATQLFEITYGYKEFDLVMGRTFPTSETYRMLTEEEGRNLYE